MLQSPIGWVGGKRLLRPEILKRFPEHMTYVEVFCGAAWVLFGKDRAASKAEILNDRNGELANFFRCVREKPLELMEKLKFRLASQDDFRRDRSAGILPVTEVQRAARFFWLLKQAFGSRSVEPSFGYRLLKRPSALTDYIKDVIERAHERLQFVYVFNEDFEHLLRRLDRPGTFSYCDPPYYGCEACYEGEFTHADHERLARALKDLKGKFLLSYNDCTEIKELYGWATIETVTTRYSVSRKTNGRKPVIELLIRNYA